jgi:hypothetical protein
VSLVFGMPQPETHGVAYERQRAYGRVLASGIFDPAGSTPSMPILILRVPRTRREDGGGDVNGIGDADGSTSRWHRQVAGAVTPAVTLACTPWLAMGVIFMFY